MVVAVDLIVADVVTVFVNFFYYVFAVAVAPSAAPTLPATTPYIVRCRPSPSTVSWPWPTPWESRGLLNRSARRGRSRICVHRGRVNSKSMNKNRSQSVSRRRHRS